MFASKISSLLPKVKKVKPLQFQCKNVLIISFYFSPKQIYAFL